MPKSQELLKKLALVCFFAFVISAATFTITAIRLIWQAEYEEGDELVCSSAAILTIVTALLLSGTRCLQGVLANNEED